MRVFIVCVVLLGLTRLAHAQTGNSFVTSDGLNRAAASVLHCVNGLNVAVPCGTSAQPVYVTSGAGLANVTNQATQITAAQAVANAAGTQADTVYSSGAGSMVALLKGVFTVLSGGVTSTPFVGTTVSRSMSIAAATSMTLFPLNASRHYLALQAPATTLIWVNFVGGPATPNGVDCVSLGAGTLYESGQFVTKGVVNVYAPVATSIAAWEG